MTLEIAESFIAYIIISTFSCATSGNAYRGQISEELKKWKAVIQISEARSLPVSRIPVTACNHWCHGMLAIQATRTLQPGHHVAVRPPYDTTNRLSCFSQATMILLSGRHDTIYSWVIMLQSGRHNTTARPSYCSGHHTTQAIILQYC